MNESCFQKWKSVGEDDYTFMENLGYHDEEVEEAPVEGRAGPICTCKS